MPETIILKQASCADQSEPDVLSVDAARLAIIDQITPIQGSVIPNGLQARSKTVF